MEYIYLKYFTAEGDSYEANEFYQYSYYYDKETKECYKGGSTGPCGESMLFYKESDNEVYGHCDCDEGLVYSSKSGQCFGLCEQVIQHFIGKSLKS
jgi:hypothetical protein